MEYPETNPRLEFFRAHIGARFDKAPSAVTRWLGGVLEEVTPQKLAARYEVRADMTNPMGILHGGVAATIMDDLMGALVYLLGNEHAHTSVNINCDFLNPAPVGTTLRAQAEIVRVGKNVVHCECRLATIEGKLIAKAASNLILTPVKLPG